MLCIDKRFLEMITLLSVDKLKSWQYEYTSGYWWCNSFHLCYQWLPVPSYILLKFSVTFRHHVKQIDDYLARIEKFKLAVSWKAVPHRIGKNVPKNVCKIKFSRGRIWFQKRSLLWASQSKSKQATNGVLLNRLDSEVQFSVKFTGKKLRDLREKLLAFKLSCFSPVSVPVTIIDIKDPSTYFYGWLRKADLSFAGTNRYFFRGCNWMTR